MFKLVKENNIQYYSVPNLRKVQLLQLELLKIVDKVARENDIDYWIDGGTLLGAVRHKGFIPWDDDIDVCLLKKDYDKFLPLLNNYIKNNAKYSLLYYNYNKAQHWNDFFANTSVTIIQNGIKKPLSIDIFPMKLVNNNINEIENDRYLTDILFFFAQGKVKYFQNIPNKYKSKTLKNALKKKKAFFDKYNNQHLKKNIETPEKQQLLVNYSYNDNYVKHKRGYYNYTDIFPLQEIKFEGINFKCPHNTDNYLKLLYSNYMQLPPLNMRKPNHNQKIILNKKLTSKYIQNYLTTRNKYFYYSSKPYYKLFLLLKQWKSNGFNYVFTNIIKPSKE